MKDEIRASSAVRRSVMIMYIGGDVKHGREPHCRYELGAPDWYLLGLQLGASRLLPVKAWMIVSHV